MAKVWVSPTGKLTKGHVLDVAHGPFLEALKLYDPQLYFKWNPKKLKGWGCWEIRRRPEVNGIKDVICYGGNTYTILAPKEIDIVNHVYDVAYLNYNVIEKIKKMDTWQEGYKGKTWAKEAEYKAAKWEERQEAKADVERQYNIKQIKPLIRELKEMVLSGHNPARLADHWGK